MGPLGAVPPAVPLMSLAGADPHPEQGWGIQTGAFTFCILKNKGIRQKEMVQESQNSRSGSIEYLTLDGTPKGRFLKLKVRPHPSRLQEPQDWTAKTMQEPFCSRSLPSRFPNKQLISSQAGGMIHPVQAVSQPTQPPVVSVGSSPRAQGMSVAGASGLLFAIAGSRTWACKCLETRVISSPFPLLVT